MVWLLEQHDHTVDTNPRPAVGGRPCSGGGRVVFVEEHVFVIARCFASTDPEALRLIFRIVQLTLPFADFTARR